MSAAERTPAAEAALLAGALAAAVGRARRRGRRRAVAAVRAPAEPPGLAGPTPVPAAEEPGVAGVRGRAAAAEDWSGLRACVADCTACALSESRTQTVFADGSPPARVMFVGEAPGYHEDQQGVPFVGRAGELLTAIIEKGMGLSRSEVVIANVLKCRPPENRDPSPEEKRTCTPFLDRQIELCDPEVIVALGRHAAGHLLDSDAPMGKLRGRVHRTRGRRIVATYHPAYLLRSPHMKKDCWQDVQLAMAELGLAPPGHAASTGGTTPGD